MIQGDGDNSFRLVRARISVRSEILKINYPTNKQTIFIIHFIMYF